MNYFEAMRYINSFGKSGEAVLNLDRFREIMHDLGDPQDTLPFVHVAGTNGKGSVTRMIAETLTLSGYRTGEFTSPFIHVYNDRMKIDGAVIPNYALSEIVSRLKPVFDRSKRRFSQFELTTAIAFLWFYYSRCDIVVLETGIGGLLDCTNIIETTAVSVITSVSMDHTAILGETLTQIAEQKAGIIKPRTPVVISPNQADEVFTVIMRTAAKMKADVIEPEVRKINIKSIFPAKNEFMYKGMPYQLRMCGRHQIQNAVTAIETLEILKKSGLKKITYSTVFEGIEAAYLPSRCQVVKMQSPMIIIDGAHNPDGMKKLASFIREIPKTPKIMIVGMREDKDWYNALSEITRYIDRAVCVDGFVPGTVKAEHLAALFENAVTASITTAFSTAVNMAGDSGVVIIGGSLCLPKQITEYRIQIL
ncbi:MAG: bifunctional folylpolyglutamate synthase/dihydrofolate synthase [Ruminococcus sp.]|jgi:dihydrofolate synthase/folylpolyglutamate synthase|nr:bifunctional folylpolyglutamate synthase/dihydrofolate synthase [Ruminococcus sp.]